MCNVTDTHTHLYKLRPRSGPSVVTGTGPSTTQYRACLLHGPKLAVHIVRHMDIYTSQHEEILTRTVCPFGAHRKGNTTFLPTALHNHSVHTVTSAPICSSAPDGTHRRLRDPSHSRGPPHPSRPERKLARPRRVRFQVGPQPYACDDDAPRFPDQIAACRSDTMARSRFSSPPTWPAGRRHPSAQSHQDHPTVRPVRSGYTSQDTTL
jgi:hypothetical protein